MASRSPNHRLAKIHRNYTLEEVATLYGVHRNTVRQWIKIGLPSMNDRRPALILGGDLVVFLKARRLKNKRPCQPGEIYCVRCREPRVPARQMVHYEPRTMAMGDLVGTCPRCETVMYRRTSLATLHQVCGPLSVALPKGLEHLGESPAPSVNSEFSHQAPAHDNAQPK